MTFDEILAQFKEKEQPEDALPLLGKEEGPARLRRLALAWGKIKIDRLGAPTDLPSGDFEKWEWLWLQVMWDDADLKMISGLAGDITHHLHILRGNRIIYPDGTISAYATKALRQIMKQQLNL